MSENTNIQDKGSNTNERQYSALFSEGCRYLFSAIDESDKDSAFSCFFEGSKLDDADCIYYLGMCFEYGFGCEIDLEAAYITYQKTI